jgi:hypothetical protein
MQRKSFAATLVADQKLYLSKDMTQRVLQPPNLVGNTMSRTRNAFTICLQHDTYHLNATAHNHLPTCGACSVHLAIAVTALLHIIWTFQAVWPGHTGLAKHNASLLFRLFTRCWCGTADDAISGLMVGGTQSILVVPLHHVLNVTTPRATHAYIH